MKKILLGITILGLTGSCARWEDTQKDFESDTKGLKRTVQVYTLDGKKVADRWEVNTLIRGVYIVDGRKVVIK